MELKEKPARFDSGPTSFATLRLETDSTRRGQLKVRFGCLRAQLLAEELPDFAFDFEEGKGLIELFFIAASVSSDKGTKEVRVDRGDATGELAIDLGF
jgi:hypothetical protein